MIPLSQEGSVYAEGCFVSEEAGTLLLRFQCIRHAEHRSVAYTDVGMLAHQHFRPSAFTGGDRLVNQLMMQMRRLYFLKLFLQMIGIDNDGVG